MASEPLHPLPEPPKGAEPVEIGATAPIGDHDARDVGPVVRALELGWRLAVLYADLEEPIYEVGVVDAAPACLPALESMPNGDQLELQIRAAASLALRLKAGSHASDLVALAEEVHATCGSPRESLAMRERLYECHTGLIKTLWASQEAQGRAYELGTSLFDSWNRIRLADRKSPRRTVLAWRAVFGDQRIDRLKVLLDNLQSQLPPTAVTVVKAHLDFWSEAVDAHVDKRAVKPPKNGVAILRSQTIIWRQLLTKDKEPEAFLGRDDRHRLHREYTRLVWASFLRPRRVLAALTVLAVLTAGLMSGAFASSAAKGVFALVGAIGISQASLAVIARDRVRKWTELLWNRALANVVFDATCKADEAFAFEPPRLACSLADAGRRVVHLTPPDRLLRPTPKL
jgi:hypothetical protein